MDTWLILIALAATIGGSLVSLLGWAKQEPHVPFDLRDFVISVGLCLISGAGYAVTLATKTDNLTKDIIIAAVIGSGGDMALRGVIGTIATTGKPTLKPPTT